jgi:excinuclease ABC subunit C
MKIYQDISLIAAAEISDLVERGKISETTARAVRAAARLALEDQEAAKKRLAKGTASGISEEKGIDDDIGLSIGESLAAEAAAEPTVDYSRAEEGKRF